MPNYLDISTWGNSGASNFLCPKTSQPLLWISFSVSGIIIDLAATTSPSIAVYRWHIPLDLPSSFHLPCHNSSFTPIIFHQDKFNSFLIRFTESNFVWDLPHPHCFTLVTSILYCQHFNDYTWLLTPELLNKLSRPCRNRSLLISSAPSLHYPQACWASPALRKFTLFYHGLSHILVFWWVTSHEGILSPFPSFRLDNTHSYSVRGYKHNGTRENSIPQGASPALTFGWQPPPGGLTYCLWFPVAVLQSFICSVSTLLWNLQGKSRYVSDSLSTVGFSFKIFVKLKRVTEIETKEERYKIIKYLKWLP